MTNCCMSPHRPERHAAYCVSTRPARAAAPGPGMFGSWSNEEVMRQMSVQADACVAVVQMSHEERHRVGKKGEASPEQAAIFNAVIVQHLQREARERGIA